MIVNSVKRSVLETVGKLIRIKVRISKLKTTNSIVTLETGIDRILHFGENIYFLYKFLRY